MMRSVVRKAVYERWQQEIPLLKRRPRTCSCSGPSPEDAGLARALRHLRLGNAGGMERIPVGTTKPPGIVALTPRHDS